MYTININYPRFNTVDLLGVYQKGKKSKNYRILLKEHSTKQHYLLWLDETHQLGARFESTPIAVTNYLHLKQRSYNYYLTELDPLQYYKGIVANFIVNDGLLPDTLISFLHTNYSKRSNNYPIYY